ncbi:isochorismatase family protein [Undibacter mobilis]|uniref:Isochorismatase family protein n=1 Tax=Undibacter mobilis TaxID=2292256 RepID=A0A371B317_9BRAD|nr:isochorismatase family protein [Undibacter mobilis]RDV01985.1 isochorismatase family protein [Undibacter mobilis]
MNSSVAATLKTVIKSDSASNEVYARQGMGQRIGFGKRPAVLLIDMQNDFCDKDAPTTLYPSITSTYEPIKQLSAAARKHKAPVIYTQGLVAADGSSAGLWRLKTKHHGLSSVQIEGSRGAAIIDELTPQPGDRLIRKWRPSAFFRTDLEVFLGVQQIDTLLICGTSMSGCVRATAVDGFMRDIRCMIVREGVADRSDAVMDANLFDVDQKYGDVVTLEMCLQYFEGLPKAAAL